MRALKVKVQAPAIFAFVCVFFMLNNIISGVRCRVHNIHLNIRDSRLKHRPKIANDGNDEYRMDTLYDRISALL